MPVLLSRMRRDFDASGGLTTSTAVAMWSCYGLGGALYAECVAGDRHRALSVPLVSRRASRDWVRSPPGWARSGAALTAGYAAICAWWVRVEERSLHRTFGHDYDRYKRRTPRWAGRSRDRA